MSFAVRPPSQTWEAVPVAEPPGHFVWAWFRPANLPHGVVLRVPDEVLRDESLRGKLTIRGLLQAAGVDPARVSLWYLYGVPYETHGGTAPALDEAIAAPPAGADPSIVVCVDPRPAESAPQPTGSTPQPAAGFPAPQVPAAGAAHPAISAPGAPAAAAADAAAIFEAIELDWHACLRNESQLMNLRKQLAAMLGRLNTLNRDLTPDERIYAARADKSDWLIARRWLRNVATRVSKAIKEHDIGETSTAGRRQWLADVYDQFIAPRRPFADLAQAQREFESHRKMLQSLLVSMNTVYTAAAQDGEQRAQQVLGRMSASVRTGRMGRGRG